MNGNEKTDRTGIAILLVMLILFFAVAICTSGGGDDWGSKSSGGGVYSTRVPDLSDEVWDMYFECTARQRAGGWNLVEAANRCEKLRP